MSSRMPACAILASLVLAASAPSAQSKVWVVDASGGGDFLDLEPAVQTAAPGDTLLVRSGVYGATSISKALSVIAESGVQPQIAGGVLGIGPTPAGSVTVLRGVRASSIVLSQCAGTVWLEDVVSKSTALVDGLSVDGCSDVVVVSSDLRGAPGLELFELYEAGHGLHAVGSTVHVFESMLQGGAGYAAFASPITGHPGGRGGDGARLSASILVLSGCSLSGGAGGAGASEPGVCADGGDGGDGAALLAGAQAFALDCDLAGGAAGLDPAPTGGTCTAAPGAPGAASSGGAVASLGTQKAFALSVPSPLREGQSALLTVSGAGHVTALLGVGLAPGATLLPGVGASLLIQPASVVPLGVVVTSVLSQTFTAGQLPPGVDAATLYLQAAYVTSLGTAVLGEGTALTVLDAAF